MVNYKEPNRRASETVTFRLSNEDKSRLAHLAKQENKSMTDVIRRLVNAEVNRLGLAESMELTRPAAKTKPVRRNVAIDSTLTDGVANTLKQDLRTERVPTTLGELAKQFRDTFKDRAEGTRRELDETLRLLTGVDSILPALLPIELPLVDLTPSVLHGVRDALATMDSRVAQKNLHLTYLRMMFHFAVTRNRSLNFNPAVALVSFTISEVPSAWPGRLDPE